MQEEVIAAVFVAAVSDELVLLGFSPQDARAADFSSVFRAAEKLAASGAIRKLTLEEGRARFEEVDAHHDHLHCTRCGELVSVPCLFGAGDLAALEREAGIAILDHHLVLSGVCRDCHAT